MVWGLVAGLGTAGVAVAGVAGVSPKIKLSVDPVTAPGFTYHLVGTPQVISASGLAGADSFSGRLDLRYRPATAGGQCASTAAANGGTAPQPGVGSQPSAGSDGGFPIESDGGQYVDWGAAWPVTFAAAGSFLVCAWLSDSTGTIVATGSLVVRILSPIR